MSSRRLVLWITALMLAATEAIAGPVRIHIEGTLTGPDGRPTYDGIYPVTIRLWNGGATPIITVDTVRIRVVKGGFRTHIGPYAALTRELFSPRKSLSFQFAGEPEIAPRTPLDHMASSGEIFCHPIRLTTATLPATDAGTRIRLRMLDDNSSIEGILLSMTSRRIEIMETSRPGFVEKRNFDSVTSLDISTRFRRYGQVGLLSGLALGATAGYAMGSGEEDDLNMSKETKRAFDALAGAILGGLTGYLIGNSITTDRWQSLPIEDVRERARSEEEVLARERP